MAGLGSQGHGHRDEFAFGREVDAVMPARVVEVTMLEGDGTMLFKPALGEAARGEQMRFVLASAGTLEHEFVVGSVK